MARLFKVSQQTVRRT
nr:hypothetical protein [Paracoccus mutanolyticus]